MQATSKSVVGRILLLPLITKPSFCPDGYQSTGSIAPFCPPVVVKMSNTSEFTEQYFRRRANLK
jgi:hypothetical protein